MNRLSGGYPALAQWMQQGGGLAQQGGMRGFLGGMGGQGGFPGMGGMQQPGMAQPSGLSPDHGWREAVGPLVNPGSAAPIQNGPGSVWGAGGAPFTRDEWGQRSPGVKYNWADLSAPSDPQWLGNFLQDYAGKMGYFGDPRHSAMFDYSRQQAAQNSGAMQRRAQMAAQVSGLPQGQRGYAWLQGMLGGQGNEAMANNQFLQQQFQQQQDYARQLAMSMSQTPDTRAQTQALKQQTNMAWMGPIAQIGGAALGAFGGFGGGAGGAMGGAPTMGQPGFQYPYYGG